MRQRPELNRARLERVAELMNSAVPDSLVVGFETLEAALTSLPDTNDRHVLAAAIHSGAQEIVTFNLRDFTDAVLGPYGIRAVHPDAFVEHLLDLNTEAVCERFAEFVADFSIHPIQRLTWSQNMSATGLL